MSLNPKGLQRAEASHRLRGAPPAFVHPFVNHPAILYEPRHLFAAFRTSGFGSEIANFSSIGSIFSRGYTHVKATASSRMREWSANSKRTARVLSDLNKLNSRSATRWWMASSFLAYSARTSTATLPRSRTSLALLRSDSSASRERKAGRRQFF